MASGKWVHKHCLDCGSAFKPRGPKLFCSRICKSKYRARETVDKNREMVSAIKLAKGCEHPECQWIGEFSAEMLDFDHIDPSTKRGNIAMMLNCTVQNILSEIAKCRVYCANCHRKHTKETNARK